MNLVILRNYLLHRTYRCVFIFGPCLALLFTSCIEKDNTGIACGEPLNHQLDDPILGEQATIEIVRIQRDSNCLSFHCLEHSGLPAYCTKMCDHQIQERPISCTSNSQCPSTMYCHLGLCISDDCPPGFWCQEVQSSGPFAGMNFCVRRNNCRSNSDCGSLGQMDCIEYGCFDQCLLDSNCKFNKLVCTPKADLPCQCQSSRSAPSEKCKDQDLHCQLLGENTEPWPPGSVHQTTLCTTQQETSLP